MNGKERLIAEAVRIVAATYRPRAVVSNDSLWDCIDRAMERFENDPAENREVLKFYTRALDHAQEAIVKELRQRTKMSRPGGYRRRNLSRKQRSGKRHKQEWDMRRGETGEDMYDA